MRVGDDHVVRATVLVEIAEEFVHLRVANRLAAFVLQQVLLGYIGDIIVLLVLGQKMVKWLFFGWAAVFGDGVVPRVRIGKDCVHVKDHTAERVVFMAYNLANMIFRT